MKKLVSVFAGAAVGATFMAASASAETTLTVSSWLPPFHPIVKNMIVPWGEQITKATNGNIKIKVLAKPLGAPPAHFDLAKNGLADITYGVHGYTPGRFHLTQIAEGPFLGDSAEAVSVAYWHIHEKFLAKADEHKGVKLLGVFSHGPGVIYNSKVPADSVGALKGLKFRVGGGLINEISKAMGVVPLSAPASKSYEILSNGVADGIMFPAESPKSFKLTKLLKYATKVPGGLYNTSFFLVMNQARWDKLSDADKKAIESVSGEAFAHLAGKAWDAADAAGYEAMKADGMQVMDAPAAMVDELKKIADPIVDAWAEDATKKRGVDAKAALAALRAEAAAFK